MEIDRFTGGILPRVKLPDSEKMVIDRLWRDPERRARPFSEQGFLCIIRRRKTCGRQRIPREKCVRSLGEKADSHTFKIGRSSHRRSRDFAPNLLQGPENLNPFTRHSRGFRLPVPAMLFGPGSPFQFRRGWPILSRYRVSGKKGADFGQTVSDDGH
jgi:hypothetical protein